MGWTMVKPCVSVNTTEQFSGYSKGSMIDIIPARIFVYGASGSGKSSLVQSMLASQGEEYSFDWDRCFYFTTKSDKPTKVLKKFDIQVCSYAEEFRSINLSDLEKQFAQDNLHRVYIFDDIPKECEDMVYQMSRFGRPRGCSVIVCSQGYNGIYKEIRNQSNLTMMTSGTPQQQTLLVNKRMSGRWRWLAASESGGQYACNDSPYSAIM